MFIAFLPRLESQEVLERHYEDEIQRGEIEAEIGSSYFHGGASSWDASSMARSYVNQLEEDFARSAEGEVFMARLEAAQFAREALSDLDVVSLEEINDPRIFTRFGALRVPEWFPGVVIRSDFSAPSNGDIPF